MLSRLRRPMPRLSSNVLACVMLATALALGGCAATQTATRGPAAGGDPEKREKSFDEFLDEFRGQAIAAGIRKETVDKAFDGLVPNDRVLALMDSQPEFVRPIWDYMSRTVSDRRIRQGRERLAQHRTQLAAAESKTGVPARVIVAIWGLETNYGSNTGSFSIIQALATQAWKGRRAAWARGELMNALRILDNGDMTLARFKGSWAGAFGQTQFMPSVYLSHSVDADGDGKRDILGSTTDAFHSTGNLLRHYNWKRGEPWGFEVKLPRNFPWEDAEYKVSKTLAEWRAMGVRRTDNSRLAQGVLTPQHQASIIIPAGHRGPAFLILGNFRSLLRYNRATSYALSVAHLSDRLAGRGPFLAAWPTGEQPLKRSEMKELQQRLTAIGCDAGKPDGVIGRKTRAAVRCYQRQTGQPADGYPTLKLLARLRGGGTS
jgi:membrane-bound lytic murein transglycosylase B